MNFPGLFGCPKGRVAAPTAEALAAEGGGEAQLGSWEPWDWNTGELVLQLPEPL